MALVNTGDSRIYYRYSIEELLLLYDDESKSIPIERINSFAVLNDYIENLNPMMKIVFSVEQSIYDKLISTKNDVNIKLTMRKYYRKGTKKKTSTKKNHINMTFQLILPQDENKTKEAIRKKTYPNGDEGHMESVNRKMELYLYQTNIIKGNRDVIDLIAEDCNVLSAIGYLIGNSSIKNIVMTKPDNTMVYSELIIPDMPLARAFMYLDSFYGIYKTGSIIYFGLRRSYFLRYRYSKNACDPNTNDTVSVIVPNIGSSISDSPCQIKKLIDDMRDTVVIDPNTFNPEDTEDSSAALVNTDVAVVEDGEIDGDVDDDVAIAVPKGVNPFYRTIYRAILNPKIIHCTFKNVDIDILTPDKKYQFLFEDTKMTKKYKGYYSLVQLNVTYTKTGSEYVATAIATFHSNL